MQMLFQRSVADGYGVNNQFHSLEVGNDDGALYGITAGRAGTGVVWLTM